VLLPMGLAMCSSPATDNGALVRPVEGQAVPSASHAAETVRPAKVRRVEDLPPASPVAVRPLRVDELPEAPPSRNRSRRGKHAKDTVPVAESDVPGARAGLPAAAGQALRVEDLPSVSAAVRALRNDELNPELVRRADDLLWNHRAPVGTDIPFEVNGKSYIARFALHYHEFGSAQKPWGYHKGVTLYSTEP
jgi:hypothetical protein